MNVLNHNELKQIKLLETRIDLFEKNKLTLFDFVNELGGILNLLESPPESWKDNFQANINSLELIFDAIEDNSITRYKGDFRCDIQQVVLTLKNMTTTLLEEYLKISDPNVHETATELNLTWLMCPKCQDAWESQSKNAMVICPNCIHASHNPRSL